MPGIYLHIPFCKQACHYCDFHFSTSLKNKEALVKAIVAEIHLRKDYLHGDLIDTVYLGGGTPSLLSKINLELIFEAFHRNFRIYENAEITLEANPDDINRQKLSDFRNCSINRLSIGVQSFHDNDLRYMNRAHTCEQARKSVRDALNAGFGNLNIDLIYGTPTMNLQQWIMNIEIALEFQVPHLSCYCLTVEPKTALKYLIKKGKAKDVDEQVASEQFEVLMNKMREAGFLHYEISNFCIDGFYSNHNTSYWRKEPFVGFGPSAHSFDGSYRQWNVSNNSSYIKSLQAGKVPYTLEELTPVMHYNEYVMTGLRTMWGCDLSHISTHFGEEVAEKCLTQANRYIEDGLMTCSESNLTLTDQGKLLANTIAADLFIEEDDS